MIISETNRNKSVHVTCTVKPLLFMCYLLLWNSWISWTTEL